MVAKPASVSRSVKNRAILEEWRERVEALFRDVRAWSEAQGWSVTESQIELTEDKLGTYTLPTLTVELPEGKVLFTPVGRWVYKAEGRVDMISYPTWDQARLMSVDGVWIPRIALGLTWPIPWSRECYLDLAQRLVSEP